jgi:beta-glucosidase
MRSVPPILLCLGSAVAIAVAAFAQPAPEGDPGDLVSQLTLEEKASLITGRNSWETAAVERLGIPPVWMTDGPVGLRRSTGEALTDSVPATCFPSAAAMAATWDPQLIERVGAAIGAEARANDVILLLGPGLNMKRHPLGGRNFEYYSEDPLLSGRIAGAFVRGVQSEGVGATLKHFAVNNQEYRRMSIDARVGERALREIYLRGFEIAVEEGAPQAVMSAYNKVNGVGASENKRLLTEILRQEWGWDGLVVSDWGAVDEPAAAITAGLDLEMPSNPLTPPRIVQAVKDGALDEADLDRAVAAVLQLVERQAAQTAGADGDLVEAHHELAREVALESLVLLENDGLLPVAAMPAQRIGVVGRLAREPRIQGIGSSQVNATRVDDAWSRIEQLATEDGHSPAIWAADYDEKGLTESERTELARFLADRDLVLVFAGQKASHDAEAWDRPSMSLAPADLEVLAAVEAVGKPFVVVVVGGGAVDVRPFAAEAGAVLMGWLGGQGFGAAVADALFGRGTPSGKLSESFAWTVADHASAINFPGGPWAVDYGEGLWVGYRYFQTFDRAVAYPFGHGLSYGAVEITEATAPEALESPASFEVGVTLRNNGSLAGAETVQVYLRHLEPSLMRPDRELIGFRKVRLEPGETAEVAITIEPERLAYFHDGHARWVIEPGAYELLIGVSAADIRATLPLELATGTLPAEVFTLAHIIGDVRQDPQGKVVIDFMLEQAGRGPVSQAAEDDFFAAILMNLPFKKLAAFSQGAVTMEMLQGLLFLINGNMPPEQVDAMLRQAAAAQAPAG